VVPVLTSNCYVCHSGAATAGAGIKLDNYASVKVQVNNGRLLGSIEHKPGFSPMPKGGAKMQDCDIAKIRTWIKAGAPNN
jgi:mono/diheme cytochrome c family protein